MEGAAEALTPMAELSTRWGINSNTVSRRLRFLGIKPIRKGNFRFLDPDQMVLAEALQAHILSGKPMDDFPRPDGESTAITRNEDDSRQVARLVPETALLEEMAKALAVLQRQSLPAEPSPSEQVEAMERAAQKGLPHTQKEMSKLIGREIGPKDDQISPRPGFKLHRIEHTSGRMNKDGQPMKSDIYWILTLEKTTPPIALKPAEDGMAGGMLGGFAARALIDVSAIDATGSDLFDRMKL